MSISLRGCPKSVTNADDVCCFVSWCVDQLAGGYHPDTRFWDYVEVESGDPTFSVEDARKLQDLQDAAFAIVGDGIYLIGCILFREAGLLP